MTAIGPTWRTRPPDRPFPRETLTSALDGGGIRHAIYPTASRTLCSKTDEALDVRGDTRPPDCLACATAAAAFDHIDNSAPSDWFRNGEEANAA
jgi:hypothetical protein